MCNLAIVEQKDDIGGLMAEFVLDLNGSRIISRAGIENRDGSPLRHAEVAPTRNGQKNIACLSGVGREKERVDKFSQQYLS